LDKLSKRDSVVERKKERCEITSKKHVNEREGIEYANGIVLEVK